MASEFSTIANQFSNDIFTNCIAEKTENVILSPISIQIALSLLFMAAKGKTANEMSFVMKYENVSRDELENHFQKIMASSSMMKIANKIYVKEGFEIKQNFNEIAKSNFFSEVQNINFAEKEISANEINKWVEKITNEKIRNLVQPRDLQDTTRMILINAIYFKGTWVKKFIKSSTVPRQFWVNEEQSINVPMMHVKAYFKYGQFEDLDALGLEMPYKDSDISMLVILPNKREGLKDLEENLSQINYSTLTEKLSVEEVNVSLPKFKFEFEIELNNVLKQMGMETMFNKEADFSDLLETPEQLMVSSVIHKAFIDVNEDGTEAAAATKVSLMLGSAPAQKTISFVADHPFVFLLKDSNNIIYFRGHVYNCVA